MSARKKRLARLAFWYAVCALLVLIGVLSRDRLLGTSAGEPLPAANPLIEVAKLAVAFLLGRMLTDVHRMTSRSSRVTSSHEQAQVLLCITGALMMIIISDSLARALGIAGAASLIRFRTPVDDPKDAVILFLSLGLGLACGLGAVAVAALSAAFLAMILLLLDRTTPAQHRTYMLSVSGPEPGSSDSRVREILARRGLVYETSDVVREEGTEKVRYKVRFPADANLADITQELESQGARAVSWETPKNRRV